VQNEFAPIESEPQRALDIRFPHRALLHGRVVAPEGFASGNLRLVHGGIGIVKQRLELPRIDGIAGHADARRDKNVLTAECEGFLQRLADPRGNLGSIEIVCRRKDYHGKFVAAEPAHCVSRTHATGQSRRKFAQQRIAHRVAERVVHDLEKIDIYQQDGNDKVFRIGAHKRIAQRIVQQRAIGKTGQRVVSCQMHELLLRLAPLGDVFDDLDDPGTVAGRIGDRKGPCMDPAFALVGMNDPILIVRVSVARLAAIVGEPQKVVVMDRLEDFFERIAGCGIDSAQFLPGRIGILNRLLLLVPDPQRLGNIGREFAKHFLAAA